MPALDLLVIDEAHHAVAASYRRIIDRVRNANPGARVFGVTATPNRGDRSGLREVFSNVADQVRLGELIASGHLVRPRTFVIDLGVQEKLREVRRTADDFDMGEVDGIMNRAPITEEVIRHWREKAGDRQTVVFCSTVDHARNVTGAFRTAGVSALLVHGDMPADERRATLAAYASGRVRVVVNVAVLTEGWDHPPTSCVVLLRPSSYKSTMIQMVGRGLRTVSPEEHPGVVKTDCIVLDFGCSIPARVAALKTMPMPELKAEWRALFDTEPPPFNRRHLENRIAYRIQELAYGGLKPETLRRLEILGEQYDSDSATTRRIRHDARPVAGTRLVREYRGVEHTVTVLADGYEWEGRPYRSLSAIARAITGTRWNGLVFWGLKRQGGAE